MTLANRAALQAIFLISFCGIMLELLQMKYLTVILNSTSNFLILTLALFMYSLSSATLSFWNKKYNTEIILTRAIIIFLILASVNLRSVCSIRTGKLQIHLK